MEKMTVKELMEILANYNENDEIKIAGGEYWEGQWAQLTIGEEIIMEME